MRLLHTALWFAVSISPALAQRAPVIVVPGRPDVPVLMYGVDVSWSVIRPNEVNPNGDLSAVRGGEHGPAAELPAAAIRAWILSQHWAAPRLWPPRSQSAAQPAVAATGANLLPRLVEPILSRSYD